MRITDLVQFSDDIAKVTAHYSPVSEDVMTDLLSSYNALILAQHTNLDRYNSAVSTLGKNAGVDGQTLYYPFGGADSATGFSLSPTINDVIVQTAEPAGSIDRLLNWPRENVADVMRSVSFAGFDTSGRLYDQAGILPLALARIISRKSSAIRAIAFIRFNSEGNAELIPRAELNKNGVYDHAVIYFDDNATNSIRRYWHFKHVVNKKGPFEDFVNKFKFDTILIKSANDELFDPTILRRAAYKISLGPAKANNALVIADERHGTIGSAIIRASDNRRPIWQKDAFVKLLELPEGTVFGYSFNKGKSYFASPVFVAPASSLININTPFWRIPNMNLMYLRGPCGWLAGWFARY